MIFVFNHNRKVARFATQKDNMIAFVSIETATYYALL